MMEIPENVHPDIVVVMPAKNEAANIGTMIEMLCESIFPEVFHVHGLVMALLVIDGGSSDQTVPVVREKMKSYDHVYLGIQKKKDWATLISRAWVWPWIVFPLCLFWRWMPTFSTIQRIL